MQAINFDLIIGRHSAGGYPLTAIYQPTGDKQTDLRPIDLQEQTLDYLLDWAAHGVALHKADIHSAESLGSSLYDLLFGGRLGEPLRSAQQDASSRTPRHSLRLRLQSDDLDLLSIPWEFLYDEIPGRPFAAGREALLVRSFGNYRMVGRPGSMLADLPLRMLVVVPAVKDLDVAGEVERIRQALADRPVELTVLGGPEQIITSSKLLDRLQEDEIGFDLLHFSGHGDTDGNRGFLLFNDEDGGEDWVDGQTLGQNLEAFSARARAGTGRRGLRLAVLNSCEGGISAPLAYGLRSLKGVAPALLRAGIPAVVAMQYKILDEAALVFAREFYRALTLGDSAGLVDFAVNEARGRLALTFPGHRSFATPVLFLNAEDGRIFELEATAGQPEGPDQLPPQDAGPFLAGEDLTPAGEALLRHFRWQRPRELADELQVAQSQLQSLREQLAHFQEQIRLGDGYAALQVKKAEAEVRRLQADLGRLGLVLDLAHDARIPDGMLIEDFLRGDASRTVLQVFLGQMPRRTFFSAADLVAAMRRSAPLFVQRLGRKLLDQADADDESLALALQPRLQDFASDPANGYIVNKRGQLRSI